MIGRVLRQRYQLLEVVGQGGMAIVYRAKDFSTGRDVAVKVLREEFTHDDDFVRRFHREALAAAQMSHRNIVALIDVGEENGLRFLVMEYIRGTTLKDLIREKGRLSVARSIDIAVQICHALSHAHAKHIIHRDIKPQNILVDEFSEVKVADFGIARATTAQTMTVADGGVLGSVHYVSPEQARGGVAEEVSDIYSLGVTLYEMVTGEVPFDGDTPVTIALKHIQQPVPRPRRLNPSCSIALEEVIMKAMSKQPSQRYQSAAELEQDLERALAMPQGGFVEYTDGSTHMIATQPGTVSENHTPAPEGGNAARAIRIAVLGIIAMGLVILLVWGGNTLLAQLRGNPADLVQISTVSGKPVKQAKAELQSLGFIVTTSEAASDTVPEGLVIKVVPEERSMANRGSTVVLTVSTGPQPVPMPNIIGKDVDEGTQLIENLGVKIRNIYRQTDPEYPRNAILKTSVDVGEPIKKGAQIDITINELPEDFPMPNVIGQTEQVARSMLENSERMLQVSVFFEETDAVEAGKVARQNPAIGEMVSPNDQVEIWIATAPAQTPLPVYTPEPIVPTNPPQPGQGFQVDYEATFTVTENDSIVQVYYVETDQSIVMLLNEVFTPGTHTKMLHITRPEPGHITVQTVINGQMVTQDDVFVDGSVG